jgi:hypothetical protein
MLQYQLEAIGAEEGTGAFTPVFIAIVDQLPKLDRTKDEVRAMAKDFMTFVRTHRSGADGSP